ncbi:hypothetical protein THIOSC15_1400001 [uncultured Thiomicrorhabdus sp.]
MVELGANFNKPKQTKPDQKLANNGTPKIVFSGEDTRGYAPKVKVSKKRCKCRVKLQAKLDEMEEKKFLQELELA